MTWWMPLVLTVLWLVAFGVWIRRELRSQQRVWEALLKRQPQTDKPASLQPEPGTMWSLTDREQAEEEARLQQESEQRMQHQRSRRISSRPTGPSALNS